MRIAIVGPDGSGKSSVCAALSRHFEVSKVVYAGKRDFNFKSTEWAYQVWTKFSKLSPILGVFAQYLIYYPMEFWENYCRFTKSHINTPVVIYDRHPMDRIIMRYEFLSKFKMKKIRPLHFFLEYPMRLFWGLIYYRFFPQVDFIFLMAPPVEIIFERSEGQYKSLQEVQARREAYRSVSEKKRFVSLVKTLDILKEDSVQDICQIILDHINGHDKSTGENDLTLQSTKSDRG